MYAKANGIKIHYVIDGAEDAPWLTFATGMANDVTMWDAQVAVLKDHFRILRYDLRGHGGSDTTPGPYSFELLMDDLLGLWDALGIEKSSLVGLGLGGSMAIGMGARHSDRLEKLVPCCCRAKMTPEFAAVWPKLIETAEAQGMKGVEEMTVERWFPEEFRKANPELIKAVREGILAADPEGYTACIRAFLTLDFESELDAIDVPTLFVSGANDRLGGPPEIMEELAAKVKGARHESIPKAAHICNIENAISFNNALTQFLVSRG